MDAIGLPPPKKVYDFKPCPVCGRVEQEVKPDIWVIDHDMEKHGIAPPKRSERMDFSALCGNPELPERI